MSYTTHELSGNVTLSLETSLREGYLFYRLLGHVILVSSLWGKEPTFYQTEGADTRLENDYWKVIDLSSWSYALPSRSG